MSQSRALAAHHPRSLFAIIRDELPGWQVGITGLEDGLMGCTDPDEKVIWLSIDLDEHKMRSTLMHEIVHALRGDDTDDPVAEQTVRLETARRLIPIQALAATFTLTTDPDDICAALRVDAGVLRTRLRNLDPDELVQVRRALVRMIQAPAEAGVCLLHHWWAMYGQPNPAPIHAHCRHVDAELVGSAAGACS